MYKVLKPIWHSVDGCNYFPGDTVSLRHLDAEIIASLVADGVVEEEVTEEEPKRTRSVKVKEEVHGKDSTDNPDN